VVVCATSDAPSLVRVRAASVATAVARHFRDAGQRVLLIIDSLPRGARAQREGGLSAGEPPARHGYPPSVFALLPRLVERAGTAAVGSITAVYAVLVAGDDLDEPIADEVRGIVDGHIVLDRRLAARGHFPPIDVLASVSRLFERLAPAAQRAAAARVRTWLARYEERRDLIQVGAYKPGADRALDEAVARQPAIEGFLRQTSRRELGGGHLERPGGPGPALSKRSDPWRNTPPFGGIEARPSQRYAPVGKKLLIPSASGLRDTSLSRRHAPCVTRLRSAPHEPTPRHEPAAATPGVGAAVIRRS
jgi:hypothetical protein